MNTVQIILDVPAELIERARAEGVELQTDTDKWIDGIERLLRRNRAARELGEIAAEIQALPESLRPTPDEIAAEVRGRTVNL
jgi:hypothetical protein